MERAVTEFLTFTAVLLETAVSGDPPQPAKGERTSGPWYRRVPGTKQYLPFVREFAASGGMVSLSVGTAAAIAGRIAPPLDARPASLLIDTRFSLFGSEGSHVFDVPYPSDPIRDLCLGQWVEFGPGAAKFNPKCLLPTLRIDGELTIIEWPSPPEVQVQIWQEHPGLVRRALGRMVKRLTHTTIDRVVIRPEYIDVQAGGLLMNNAIPRIVPE